MKSTRWVAGIGLALAALTSFAQQPGSEAHIPSQAAADAIREAAGTDMAFLAAGLIKPNFNRDDLSSLIQYQDEEIVVVTLKGTEVRQALERALTLYPQSNSSFLQLSGLEVTFDPKSAAGSRVKSVVVGNGPIETGRDYRIAMPSSLGRGGYGFFKVWDRTKITSTLPLTVDKVLSGKKVVESKPRWIALS